MNQARAGRLPDFVIIGAAKSGTTSADHYLRLHPEVYMDRPKEINFLLIRRWVTGIEERIGIARDSAIPMPFAVMLRPAIRQGLMRGLFHNAWRP
jgi:hypothetical protein